LSPFAIRPASKVPIAVLSLRVLFALPRARPHRSTRLQPTQSCMSPTGLAHSRRSRRHPLHRQPFQRPSHTPPQPQKTLPRNRTTPACKLPRRQSLIRPAATDYRRTKNRKCPSTDAPRSFATQWSPLREGDCRNSGVLAERS